MRTPVSILMSFISMTALHADECLDLIMDVHSPWKSLSIRFDHHCSCLGSTYRKTLGFGQTVPNELTLSSSVWDRHHPDFFQVMGGRPLHDYTAAELREDVVKIFQSAVASTSPNKRFSKVPERERAQYLAKLSPEEAAICKQGEDSTSISISFTWKDGRTKSYWETFVSASHVLSDWMKKVDITLSTRP